MATGSNNYFSLIGKDLKRLWDGLEIPQRFVLVVLIIATFVIATYFLTKSAEPSWSVLYSDLNEPDAVAIVESFKKSGYPYKIGEDKKSILVPVEMKEDLRIFVAENDLIKNPDVGFEILDELQLGSTDFKNKLTKQRIFQGELTRSIERMNGIKKVRVQIAEPERSIFQDSDEAPSASIMLILEPGYKLKTGQVKAIKNLVAYSIPRLTPEQVFITDQDGNSLSDDLNKNSNDIESYKTNFEQQSAKKIQSVIEKIVGYGNVSVQVSADIDFNSARATIETYIPSNEKGEGVLTSSQSEVESYENPNKVATEEDTEETSAAKKKNLNYAKQRNAVNYNVSKEVKQIIYAPGSVKRMTVAVAINKVLTSVEKQELEDLVLSASGADKTRGDVITISGLQFASLDDTKNAQNALAEEIKKETKTKMIVEDILPLLVVLILGIIALSTLNMLIKKLLPGNMKEGEEVYEPLESKMSLIEEQLPELMQANIPQIEARLDPEIERMKIELNDSIINDPQEAARLLMSYIKE